MATATRKQDSCQDKSAGFSLIAVSVLLTVSALIFVSLLPGQEGAAITNKILNNAKKLERVEEAMRSFMATNGRRPCPADGQYTENTVYFGVEAGTPGVCTGNTAPIPNAPLGPDAGTGFVVGGVIPTVTLGLPDEYQFDEYGRRFTYVVDVRATDSWTTAKNNDRVAACPLVSGKLPVNSVPAVTGGIAIENTAGVGSTVTDHTLYAYISHGASGYGAWPASGSLTTLTSAQSVAGRINSGSTDVDMQLNAGVDAIGAGSTFTYNTSNFGNIKVQKDRVPSNLPSGGTDTGFDDLVWYRPDTKNTCCLGAACFQQGFQISGGGGSVAVGDVNGDGIPDLVINNPNGGNSYVYVIFGTRMGFPDPLPVGSLNGANGFSIYVGGFGVGVGVGDINGDGFGDIVPCTFFDSGTNAGTFDCYAIYGHAHLECQLQHERFDRRHERLFYKHPTYQL